MFQRLEKSLLNFSNDWKNRGETFAVSFRQISLRFVAD